MEALQATGLPHVGTSRRYALELLFVLQQWDSLVLRVGSCQILQL